PCPPPAEAPTPRRLSVRSHRSPTSLADARTMTEQTLFRRAPAARDRHTRPAAAAPSVDVVVPVYNEQDALERSVRNLHRYLSAEFPFSWRIVIADNASTDATPAIAATLARELPGVELVRIARKGRGLALREAWSRSDARVVC